MSAARLSSSFKAGPARTLYRGQDRPSALVAAAGRLYWLLAGSETVLNGSSTGTGPRPAPLAVTLGPPLALAVLGAGGGEGDGTERPADSCGEDNGGCSHLCLPTPGGPVCHCPTGESL